MEASKIQEYHAWLKKKWEETAEQHWENIRGRETTLTEAGMTTVTAENLPSFLYDIEDVVGPAEGMSWTAGRLWQLKEAIEHLYHMVPDLADRFDLFAFDPEP